MWCLLWCDVRCWARLWKSLGSPNKSSFEKSVSGSIWSWYIIYNVYIYSLFIYIYIHNIHISVNTLYNAFSVGDPKLSLHFPVLHTPFFPQISEASVSLLPTPLAAGSTYMDDAARNIEVGTTEGWLMPVDQKVSSEEWPVGEVWWNLL